MFWKYAYSVEKKEILVEEEVVDQFVDDTLIREVSAGGTSLESKFT